MLSRFSSSLSLSCASVAISGGRAPLFRTHTHKTIERKGEKERERERNKKRPQSTECAVVASRTSILAKFNHPLSHSLFLYISFSLSLSGLLVVWTKIVTLPPLATDRAKLKRPRLWDPGAEPAGARIRWDHVEFTQARPGVIRIVPADGRDGPEYSRPGPSEFHTGPHENGPWPNVFELPPRRMGSAIGGPLGSAGLRGLLAGSDPRWPLW